MSGSNEVTATTSLRERLFAIEDDLHTYAITQGEIGLRGACIEARNKLREIRKELLSTPPAGEWDDTARLDFIERTFSGMTNRERYLPVQMLWGKGCNGRTLRDACDKYMKRVAAEPATQEVG